MFASTSETLQGNGTKQKSTSIEGEGRPKTAEDASNGNNAAGDTVVAKKGKPASAPVGPGKGSDKWLLASHDAHARIYTISSGITLADLYQDGDYRLIIGDIGFTGKPKLKVHSHS